MPPMEASAPGSIGKNSPVSRRYSFNCLRVTPACTVQSMSSDRTARMSFICDRSMQTPPSTAPTWPSSDVPVPNGTTGTLREAQILTTATTSSVERANTTASGGSVS